MVSPLDESDQEDRPRTVAELVDLYLRERVSRRRDLGVITARNHRGALHLFAAGIGDRPPSTISVGDVERWMDTRAWRQPATRRAQFSYLKTFLAWLVRRRLLELNPCEELKAPREPRPAPRAMPDDAVGALLRWCPDSRARAVVWLLVGVGLRCCEVERLELADWDRVAGTVRVSGKGGHPRLLPVPSPVVEALDEYLTEYPVPGGEGPMVRSYRHPRQPMRADTISGLVSAWMDAAGLKTGPRDGRSAHALRHTCASNAFDATKDLRVAQELLGHTNLSVTSRYIRPVGLDAVRQALAGPTYG